MSQISERQTMSTLSSPQFGPIRSLFWPIHRSEISRFIPMLLMYILIVFNYSLLRLTKDTLVMTARASGAAAIPSIKFWAVFPMAFLMTWIYARLSNRCNPERLFYAITTIFLSFFALFAFVLYPLQDLLHPHAMADWLQERVPIEAQGLIAVFRNWTFTLFYVMAELWGTTVMSVLFWGFANTVTSVSDAKRYYVILGVGANLATMIAGETMIFLSSRVSWFPFYRGDLWGQSLGFMTLVVILSGLCTMLLFKKAHQSSPLAMANSKQETKIRMGVRDSFLYLMRSKYLLSITVIVIAYNISLNMIEVIWKDQLLELYPSPVDLNIFNGQILIWIGVISTLFSFMMGPILQRFGWITSALVTPAILFLTGCFFFLSLQLREASLLQQMALFFRSTPLAITVFLGALQNILTRACKFTFFDSSKEIAFIPLSQESKLKGKAAIDGIVSRFGKSGSGAIHQSLIFAFHGIAMSTSIVGLLLLLFFIGWIFAVQTLGGQFEKLSLSDQQSSV